MKPYAGERLAGFANVWQEMRATPEMVNMIRTGYRLEFLKAVRPKLSRPTRMKETKLPKDQMKIAITEVAELVKKGVLREVPKEETNRKPGFYSKMFCVAKESGGMRPVINLKPLNKLMVKTSFKMETLKKVRSALRPGMYGTTLDLSDAYYHIKIHKSSRKYL